MTSDAKEVTGHLKRWLRNKKKFAFMQDGTKRSKKNFDPTGLVTKAFYPL